MVTLNMESRNPMGRGYAENRSKRKKLLGVKGLMPFEKRFYLRMNSSNLTCFSVLQLKVLVSKFFPIYGLATGSISSSEITTLSGILQYMMKKIIY